MALVRVSLRGLQLGHDSFAIEAFLHLLMEAHVAGSLSNCSETSRWPNTLEVNATLHSTPPEKMSPVLC